MFADIVSDMTRLDVASIVVLFTLCGHYSTGMVAADPQQFKLGLLIPWTGTGSFAAGRTSASAVSIAIESIHNNTGPSANMKLT